MKCRIAGLALSLAGLAACANPNTLRRPGTSYTLYSDEVKGPSRDRCAKLRAGDDAKTRCEEFKQEAVRYLRGLNVSDQVCVEGGFGEEPTASCKARGGIVDAGAENFLIEIRDPTLDSTWKGHHQKTVMFDHAALVDIYLRDRGFE